MSAAARGLDRGPVEASGKDHERALARKGEDGRADRRGLIDGLAMDSLKILERLREHFPAKVLEVADRKPDPFAVVDPAAIVEISRFMHDDSECAMDCLSNETGVDYKDRIEVVYHLFSY